jgi:hypothetical protein
MRHYSLSISLHSHIGVSGRTFSLFCSLFRCSWVQGSGFIFGGAKNRADNTVGRLATRFLICFGMRRGAKVSVFKGSEADSVSSKTVSYWSKLRDTLSGDLRKELSAPIQRLFAREVANSEPHSSERMAGLDTAVFKLLRPRTPRFPSQGLPLNKIKPVFQQH